MGGGGAIDPTKRGMRISASSKVGPRSRRLSIFRGNERESRAKEERWGWGGKLTKGGVGGGRDNDDYNGEYHRHHLPYSKLSWVEADAAEDMTRHLEEVS